MTSALQVVYSLPFLGGAVVGALTMKVYQWQHCRALDRTHPLPGGTPRKVPGISQQFWGGLIALLVVGYVFLQVGETEARYVRLADAVANCQADLIESIKSSRELNDRRDNLSEEQRALGLLIDNATAKLVTAVLAPPEDIRRLPPEGRSIWFAGQQSIYIETTAPWRIRSEQIEVEVRQIKDARRPLPDPRCAHP